MENDNINVIKMEVDENIKETTIDGREYGICCCCLESICKKSIRSTYIWMGYPEVYNDMLLECFGSTMHQEGDIRMYICELCISMLRSALCFKRQVIRSQTEMIKRNAMIRDVTSESNKCLSTVKEEKIFEEFIVNFDNDNEVEMLTLSNDVTARTTENSRVEHEDLRISDRRKKNNQRRRNYIKMRQNIAAILEHSTMIPFRSNRGYFNCFYCDKQHAVFDELKSHMVEKHSKSINMHSIMKCILRPGAIKADCSELHCKTCLTNVENVVGLIQHLTDAHKVEFNFEDNLKPKDCILPYNLSDGRYRCSVCDEEFLFFKTLSKHMNEHSTNYICDICGRCFLLPERLRAHKMRHNDKSVVECKQCGKVCQSNITLRSHIRYKHKTDVYICTICEESYRSFNDRLKHMDLVHGRKLNLNCQVCQKRFKTPSSLNVHVKKEHLKIPSHNKFSCEVCSMSFKTKSALKCHVVTHTGVRDFECRYCHKKYGRSRTLREHLRIHENDRRWSCSHCGQAFVQKCSLRNHIRVHHHNLPNR